MDALADPLSHPGEQPPPIPQPAPAMGRRVVHGSFWMIATTAAARVASFAAQIVLGWLLSKNDFGIYALAISVSTLAGVLRDGGVRQLLVQRQRDYDALIGPVFWMAAVFNGATAVIIALLAPALAIAYHEPRVAWLMLVIAGSQALATPGAILTTRLQIDLRFFESSVIQTVSSFSRYLGAILFAVAGFGPMSFVLPLPFVSAIEWALGWYLTRERPWRSSPKFRLWWPMLRQSLWVLVGTFGIAGVNLGPNMVIGFIVPLTVVGVYFFAFQIVVQVGMMLSGNITQVLFAAFSKIPDDQARKRAAAGKSMRQVMLLAGPMCLGLGATFYPLEALIWKGRWADAAGAVHLISLFYPANIASSVAVAVIQSRGHFRAWGLTLIGMAAVALGAAAAGAAFDGTASGISLYTSAAGAAVALVVTVYGFRELGLKTLEVLQDTIPSWLLSIVAAGGAMAVDLYILTNHQPVNLPAVAEHRLFIVGIVYPVFRIVITGAVFCIVFGLLARVLLPGHLRETLQIMPARVRPFVAGALRMR